MWERRTYGPGSLLCLYCDKEVDEEHGFSYEDGELTFHKDCANTPRNHRQRWVNVYLVDQSYTGPEEDRMWYAVGKVIESRLTNSPLELLHEFIKMKDRYDELNKDRPSIFSVLSEGEYRVVFENMAACDFPEVKPVIE